MDDRLVGVGFVLHDRDAEFSGPFDDVFRTEGAWIIHTPIRAPNAKAYLSPLTGLPECCTDVERGFS